LLSDLATFMEKPPIVPSLKTDGSGDCPACVPREESK
jgi:hypothetical protein